MNVNKRTATNTILFIIVALIWGGAGYRFIHSGVEIKDEYFNSKENGVWTNKHEVDQERFQFSYLKPLRNPFVTTETPTGVAPSIPEQFVRTTPRNPFNIVTVQGILYNPPNSLVILKTGSETVYLRQNEDLYNVPLIAITPDSVMFQDQERTYTLYVAKVR